MTALWFWDELVQEWLAKVQIAKRIIKNHESWPMTWVGQRFP